MPFGKDSTSLFRLAMYVKPSWRLGCEPNKDDNEGGEDELQPDWQNPVGVAS